ncbi:AAA family ATPase [Selenomonadales bacterium OttesenSCG-928-I06]|nr:AAA family ATPase [Selenomonadales bacterium OttesenSCG-928-I06]
MKKVTLETEIISMMIESKNCLTEGLVLLKEDHFSTSEYKLVFREVKKMYTEGVHVDIVTLAHRIKPLDGGISVTAYLGTTQVKSLDTFITLSNKLVEFYRLKQLHNLCLETKDKIGNNFLADGDYANFDEDVFKEFEDKLYKINTQKKDIDILTPQQHAESMLNTLCERMDTKSNGGIKTSYAELNYCLNGGFEPGQLIIISAQTGRGKSAFAMNLMRDIAIIQKISALYINTEMSNEQLDIRWMTLLSGIKHYDLASGNVSETEFQKVMATMDVMNNSGFYSVTEPNLTLDKLTSISRRFANQKKCKFIVVDYIGRMDTLDPKLKDWEVLKLAAKKLKTLAQELNLTIVMLAQANDDEKLEGSRGMKNESDLYGYLKPLNHDEQKPEAEKCNYCLIIDKNRSGKAGKIYLNFYGDRLTFRGRRHESIS